MSLVRKKRPSLREHPVPGVGVPRPTRLGWPLVTTALSREKSAPDLDVTQAADTNLRDTSFEVLSVTARVDFAFERSNRVA